MRRPAWWTWLGIAIVAVTLTFAIRGVELAGRYLTPLCWTALILVVDGLLYRRGRSWIERRPGELLVMAAISVPSWLLFEWYDRPRFWDPTGVELWWHYQGLPPWPERGLGYLWSFATITPGVLLVSQLLEPAAERLIGQGSGGRVPREVLAALIAVGAVLAVLPLLWPSPYLAADVWLAWPLLLDPVNHMTGRPSLLGDLERGRRSRAAALLAAGLICGALWEGWNVLATAHWTYTIPFAGHLKVFEMPALGYLGFAPFAVSAFALYQAARGGLSRLGLLHQEQGDGEQQ